MWYNLRHESVYRVSQCSWLGTDQRIAVENCIKTLADVAKARYSSFRRIYKFSFLYLNF